MRLYELIDNNDYKLILFFQKALKRYVIEFVDHREFVNHKTLTVSTGNTILKSLENLVNKINNKDKYINDIIELTKSDILRFIIKNNL